MCRSAIALAVGMQTVERYEYALVVARLEDAQRAVPENQARLQRVAAAAASDATELSPPSWPDAFAASPCSSPLTSGTSRPEGHTAGGGLTDVRAWT